ncbi:MAG: phosphomannose isomerase type II C-terminal cupin domain [Candidatus Paceibacterota bacterium]|jgi:mannose-1-phosphate guanylyltransferase/mannose-1-phosphate guanylyltransferase/mannose-6-phosphate isomerase
MEGSPKLYKESRPWGNFERFTLNEPTTVKIITVNPDEAFSLQTHDHRNEFWRVLNGSGLVQIGEAEHEAQEGDSFLIKAHEKHRATAGTNGLVMLEIAFGEFDEKDLTRIEDRYGRAQQ